MGDAILVQQVTSGGEPTIGSWKYSTFSGSSINIGTHDLVIGMVGGGSTNRAWNVEPFLIRPGESPTLCAGNTGLYALAGSYSLSVTYEQTRFPAGNVQYTSSGVLKMMQGLNYGFIFYMTIDF